MSTLSLSNLGLADSLCSSKLLLSLEPYPKHLLQNPENISEKKCRRVKYQNSQYSNYITMHLKKMWRQSAPKLLVLSITTMILPKAKTLL